MPMLTNTEKQKLIKAYKSGATMKIMAERLAMTVSKIHYHVSSLQKSGEIERRRPNYTNNRKPRKSVRTPQPIDRLALRNTKLLTSWRVIR